MQLNNLIAGCFNSKVLVNPVTTYKDLWKLFICIVAQNLDHHWIHAYLRMYAHTMSLYHFHVDFALPQIELAECRCKSAVSKAEKLEVRVSDLEREKRSLEKKCAALQSKVDNESESLKEEMEVSG